MASGPSQSVFQKKLLLWYHENKRSLPWRETHDPYRIWVSEIILQQTRVAQGLPYYEKFIRAFPDVETLAHAKEDSVLRVWQGLGYYSRARNMQRCAKKVCDEFNGHFPTTYNELLTLPGIGPYTAAAIASIAFHQPHAVVDGNVFRVLARLYGMDTDTASPSGKKIFTEKANSLISPTEPGDFNQAIMEFGATLCVPQNPHCEVCPFERSCVAKATARVDLLPVKSKKVKTTVRHLNYVLLLTQDSLALRKRTQNDIWKGLYEFYLVETARPTSLEKLPKADPALQRLLGNAELVAIGKVKHILSHQELRIQFAKAPIRSTAKLPEGYQFYKRRALAAVPKPIVLNRLLEKITLLSKA